MANTLLLKRSGVAAAVPAAGNLSLGELAINYTDGNLFYKDGSNAVKVIASNQFLSVVGNVTAGGNLNGVGLSLSGNVLSAITSTSTIFTTANISGGNLNGTGLSLSGNVLSVLNSTSNITTTGNIAAAYFIGNGAALTGLTPNKIFNGTSEANIGATNGNLSITIGAASNVAVFSATGEFITGLLSVTGNITGANITATTNVTGAVISASGNISGGNLLTAGLISATGAIAGAAISGTTISGSGNVTGGNVLTGGLISATGNITGGNISTSGSGGNITGANVISGTTLSATANVIGGNVTTAGLISATGNITGGNINGGASVNATLFTGTTVSVTGGITGANLTLGAGSMTGTVVSVTGNITGANILTGGLFSATGNITSAGNISAGNITTVGLVSATGNISTGANIGVSGYITTVGNVIGGNIVTGGAVSATGNINGGNVNATLLAGTSVSASGNITGANIVALTQVVTSNITSASGLLITTSGNADIYLSPNGTGNINVNSTWINDVASPQQPNDAANKQYVDDAVTSGIHIHEPVYVATTGALTATYTGGGTTPTVDSISGNKTITFTASAALAVSDMIVFTNSFNGITGGISYFVYSTNGTNQITLSASITGIEITTLTNGGPGLAEPSVANSGVGATLTNAGANAVISIDSTALTTTQRVLVKNQANAAQNGVYTVTTVGAPDSPGPGSQWVLTRATDADQYNPASTTGMSAGDYFYIESGVTLDGASEVLTSPVGEIIIGTTDITYTQFSASTVYSAGAGLLLTGTVFSVNVDNETTAIVAGNVVVKTSANLTTPNIGAATGTSLSTTGNVTGGNLITGGIVTAAKGIQNTPIGNTVANTGAFTTLTASGAVTFTANTVSNDYTTGAVVVSGGVGIAGNLEMPGTSQIHVGSELGGDFPGAQVLLVANVNSYSQAVKQNISDGASASSDWVAVSNDGSDTANYIDMGINSNNYSDSNYTATGPNDGYLYVNGGNLVLGTQTEGKNIVFHAGNTVTANIVAVLSYSNLALSQTTVATSTTSGALKVTGGAGIGGNIYAGGLISASGNINGGNLNAAGLSLSGNVLSVLNSTANITTTGNVSSNYFLGNGAFLTGVITSVANINNGTSNINIASANANITVSVNGTSNVVVFASAGEYVTGLLSVTGNITGGNLITGGSGLFDATTDNEVRVGNGSVKIGNPLRVDAGTSYIDFFSGNSSPPNFDSRIIATGGTASNAGGDIEILAATTTMTGAASVIGNITGGNLNATGLSLSGNVVSALNVTANIRANNIDAINIVSGASLTGGIVSVTGSVTGGNLITGGLASVVGNITGGNLSTTGLATISTITIATAGNVTATTASTGTASGAFVIAGGLGVGGNIYAGALYDNGTAVLTVNSTVDGGTY